MKTTLAISLVLFLELATAAQIPRTKAALTALQNANPAVDWNIDSAKTADFDCDGKADTVMLGYQKDRVVVGVVWASPRRPPQILSFPIGVPTQDGFSSPPKLLNIQPLDCTTNDGRPLPGCRATPDCKAFSIPDDDGDPFNFYWDSSRSRVAWWRM